MENYEVKQHTTTYTSHIIESAQQCGIPHITNISVGRVLNYIWGNEVRKCPNKPAYENISKRSTEKYDTRTLTTIGEEELSSILSELCQQNTGWILTSYDDDKSELLKVLKGKRIDGHQLMYEVELLHPRDGECQVNIRAHGHSVPLEKLEIWGDPKVTVSRIDALVKVLDLTSICLGFPVQPGESFDTVPSVTTATYEQDGGEYETRAISKTCLILCQGQRCKECNYSRKLFLARDKRKNKETLHPHHNNRYLDKAGLEKKVTEQRKSLDNARKREERLRSRIDSEMVAFGKEDESDLTSIFNGIEVDRVPPGLQILWEQQMKQLKAKSKMGHRWHARFVLQLSLSTA